MSSSPPVPCVSPRCRACSPPCHASPPSATGLPSATRPSPRSHTSVPPCHASLWCHTSPEATCPRREERESWIRAKYEQRLFLAPLPAAEAPLGEQLLQAVQEKDLEAVLLLLAHSKKEQLGVSDKDRRTALHLACDMALVVITQLLVWVRPGRAGSGGGHGVAVGHLGWPWGW